MCDWGNTVEVVVRVPSEQSSMGKDKSKLTKIDSCIADLVRALQEAGIDMKGSCCGHGEYLGYIWLRDGRFIFLTSRDIAERFRSIVPDRTYTEVPDSMDT